MIQRTIRGPPNAQTGSTSNQLTPKAPYKPGPAMIIALAGGTRHRSAAIAGRFAETTPAPPPDLQQIVDVFAESRIGQVTPKLFPRDRLQDDPRVVRELPQHWVQLPPQLVGGVVPRQTQIQRKLGQRIKPL